jgi:hypothetical protein
MPVCVQHTWQWCAWQTLVTLVMFISDHQRANGLVNRHSPVILTSAVATMPTTLHNGSEQSMSLVRFSGQPA